MSHGRSIMRCTSSVARVSLRAAATMIGPNVRLGTNWLSMMSQCTHSRAGSTIASSSASFEKSADKMLGATIGGVAVMTLSCPAGRGVADVGGIVVTLADEPPRGLQRDAAVAREARARRRVLRHDRAGARPRRWRQNNESLRLELLARAPDLVTFQVGHHEHLLGGAGRKQQRHLAAARKHALGRGIGGGDETFRDRVARRPCHAADAEAGVLEQQLGAAPRLAEEFGDGAELFSEADGHAHPAV